MQTFLALLLNSDIMSSETIVEKLGTAVLIPDFRDNPIEPFGRNFDLEDILETGRAVIEIENPNPLPGLDAHISRFFKNITEGVVGHFLLGVTGAGKSTLVQQAEKLLTGGYSLTEAEAIFPISSKLVGEVKTKLEERGTTVGWTLMPQPLTNSRRYSLHGTQEAFDTHAGVLGDFFDWQRGHHKNYVRDHGNNLQKRISAKDFKSLAYDYALFVHRKALDFVYGKPTVKATLDKNDNTYMRLSILTRGTVLDSTAKNKRTNILIKYGGLPDEEFNEFIDPFELETKLPIDVTAQVSGAVYRAELAEKIKGVVSEYLKALYVKATELVISDDDRALSLEERSQIINEEIERANEFAQQHVYTGKRTSTNLRDGLGTDVELDIGDHPDTISAFTKPVVDRIDNILSEHEDLDSISRSGLLQLREYYADETDCIRRALTFVRGEYEKQEKALKEEKQKSGGKKRLDQIFLNHQERRKLAAGIHVPFYLPDRQEVTIDALVVASEKFDNGGRVTFDRADKFDEDLLFEKYEVTVDDGDGKSHTEKRVRPGTIVGTSVLVVDDAGSNRVRQLLEKGDIQTSMFMELSAGSVPSRIIDTVTYSYGDKTVLFVVNSNDRINYKEAGIEDAVKRRFEQGTIYFPPQRNVTSQSIREIFEAFRSKVEKKRYTIKDSRVILPVFRYMTPTSIFRLDNRFSSIDELVDKVRPTDGNTVTVDDVVSAVAINGYAVRAMYSRTANEGKNNLMIMEPRPGEPASIDLKVERADGSPTEIPISLRDLATDSDQPPNVTFLLIESHYDGGHIRGKATESTSKVGDETQDDHRSISTIDLTQTGIARVVAVTLYPIGGDSIPGAVDSFKEIYTGSTAPRKA